MNCNVAKYFCIALLLTAFSSVAATDKKPAKKAPRKAPPTTLVDNPEAQLQQIRQEMGKLRQSVKQTQKSREAIKANIRRLSKDIQKNTAVLQKTRNQRETLSRALQDLRQEQGLVEAALARQKQVLAYQSRTLAMQPQTTPLQALLRDDPPGTQVAQWFAYRYAQQAHVRQIERHQDTVHYIQVAAVEVDQTRAKTLRVERSVEQKKQALEQQQQQHQQADKTLAKTIKQQEQRLQRLQRDARNLDRLLTRLAAEAARRAESARLKQRQQESPASKSVQAPVAAPVGTGQLSPPVDGPITVRFGSSRVKGGMSWQGVIFNVAAGAPVRAIAAGRVVYVGNLRGYGLLIIVDHGNGLMSLYGNLQGVSKSMDSSVQANEHIAAVGSSPDLGQPGFYFEMRAGRHPVDPLRYLRLR